MKLRIENSPMNIHDDYNNVANKVIIITEIRKPARTNESLVITTRESRVTNTFRKHVPFSTVRSFLKNSLQCRVIARADASMFRRISS